MPSKSKKQTKTPSRQSNSDPSASPRTPSVTSVDSEVSEEELRGSLEELSRRFPSLIGKSALIGRVNDVDLETRGCKIWLSENSMVSSYIAPGSLVSVSLAALKNKHSNGFPLSSVTDECGKPFGVDSANETAKGVGHYFALATVFPSCKVLKNGVRLSSSLSYTLGSPSSGSIVRVYPIQSEFQTGLLSGSEKAHNPSANCLSLFSCKQLYLELTHVRNKKSTSNDISSTMEFSADKIHGQFENGTISSPKTPLYQLKLSSPHSSKLASPLVEGSASNFSKSNDLYVDSFDVKEILKDESSKKLIETCAASWLYSRNLLCGNLVAIPILSELCIFHVRGAEFTKQDVTNISHHSLSLQTLESMEHVNTAFVVDHETKVNLSFLSDLSSETLAARPLPHVQLDLEDDKTIKEHDIPKLGGLSKEYAVLKEIISSSVKNTLSSTLTIFSLICYLLLMLLKINTGVPSPKQRLDILHTLLSKMDHCISDNQVQQLATATHGFVGADLASLCNEAALVCLRCYAEFMVSSQGLDSCAMPIKHVGHSGNNMEIECGSNVLDIPSGCSGSTSCKTVLPDSADTVSQITTLQNGISNISGGMSSVEKQCLLRLSFEDFEKARMKVRPSAMREVHAGRFDRLLYVGPPNKNDREDIFRIHLRKIPCSSDVSLKELAHLTEGCTGADISLICREAAITALEESLDVEEVTMCHLKAAIRQARPSDIQLYQDLSAKFERLVHSSIVEKNLGSQECSIRSTGLPFWKRLMRSVSPLFARFSAAHPPSKSAGGCNGDMSRGRKNFVVNVYLDINGVYYSASSALLLEDHVFDCSPKVQSDRNEVEELPFPTRRFEFCRNPGLFPLVVRVLKSLNWDVAREIRFYMAVNMYGFDHSIYMFRIIIHIFAMAGMQMEVYSLLRDIVCYYKEFKMDIFELLPCLLDSPDHVHRSADVFNVLIKVFASNLMLENGVDVYVQAKKNGLEPNIMSCNFLLKCLVEANREEFVISLFEDMKNSGPPPNVYTYTIMMHFYCKGYHGRNVDVEQATKLLEDMERDGKNPSVVTYSTYVLGLCRVGCVETALDFVRVLRSRNEPMNSYCYNAVIYGFCQKGELYEASKVLEEMKNFGISPDVYSYGILIDEFCKRGDFEKGLNLIDEMKVNGMKPSQVIYTSLFDGLCKSGLADVALNFIRNLSNDDFEYDLGFYCVLVKAFCLRGDLDSATELLKGMISNNIIPPANSFNWLIHGFCETGLLDKALELFSIMLQCGVLPTLFTFNVIADGYCRVGYLEEALKLINEMHEFGIFPNSYTYNGIIKRLCKQGGSGKACELFPEMLKKNILHDVHYSIIIDGFAKESNPRKALMFYTRMLKLGVTPTTVTYTILINLFCHRSKMHEACGLFKDMIGKGLVPDTIAYTSVIAGFCRVKDMKKAWSLYKEMLGRGYLPNVVTYTCLIDGFCHIKRMDMANLLIDEMKRQEIKPDVVTYTALISGYKKLGDIDLAHELFDEMKRKGIVPDDAAYGALGVDKGMTA
ncbi:hypothetical protein CCACVL1_15065 [Corchorus capsularis]|uniref:Uncharacterized protein n=1 Tax=Corchorus capsularis TaxID=210143 RepID=A0A1R3I437_COCAP|nr:hypothetical protein CCACVL1_15065 [Corchorus capsularis]